MASVLPCFPRVHHQRPPPRERPRKVLAEATSWHDWEPWLWGHRCSKCLVFFGGGLEDRPEVGCKGLSRSLAKLLSAAPDQGHKLASTQVGDEKLPLFFLYGLRQLFTGKGS